MTDDSILIIGAGAAGLISARELLKAGKRVIVLEAKERTGGRIRDITDPAIDVPVMLGAEFVHGPMEITLSLLKEAGIPYAAVSGISVQSKNGQLEKSSETVKPHWNEFISKLYTETEDLSIVRFLSKYFPRENYNNLWEYVISFVENYDAADPDKISIFALQKEWKKEEEEQYRIEGGYGRLVTYLENQVIESGGVLLTQKIVTHFNWSPGFAEAITTGGERYCAKKAIITLPLGVLQIKDGSAGFVNFTPPLPIRMNAVRAMGFGSVIKIVLYFSENFWRDHDLNHIGFIFSDENIPVWWTQLPFKASLLHGWLAGPKTMEYINKSKEELIQIALESLSNILHEPVEHLKQELIKGFACHWARDPLSRGAYGYTTVNEPDAGMILGKPVEDTLYFAGEATYLGPHPGTVEAAFVSGTEVVKKVLKETR